MWFSCEKKYFNVIVIYNWLIAWLPGASWIMRACYIPVWHWHAGGGGIRRIRNVCEYRIEDWLDWALVFLFYYLISIYESIALPLLLNQLIESSSISDNCRHGADECDKQFPICDTCEMLLTICWVLQKLPPERIELSAFGLLTLMNDIRDQRSTTELRRRI